MIIVMLFLTGCSQTATPGEAMPPNTPESQAPSDNTPYDTPDSTSGKETLSIVCTIFPQYDWVRHIIGNSSGRFELTLLLDNLIDLHSFQPSFRDIITIGASDVFIYIGGHSDDWVDDVLSQASNPDMVVINLLEVLGDAVVTEMEIEGAEHICDDDCDDHGLGGDIHLHEDEHVWLSLRLAKIMCAAITDTLVMLDPDNEENYRANLSAYIEKLSALDMEFQAAVDAASVTTLVFADRFPFRYLMDDYGLSYYAAFSGCSAASEASFSTIVFLATRVEELGLNNIMVTESADQSIARTVINSTPRRSQQILVLNAIQSVLRRDVDDGMTYLSIMENNLSVLREALE